MAVSVLKPVSILLFLISILLISCKPVIAQSNQSKAGEVNSNEAPVLSVGEIRVELPLQKKGKNYARGSYAFTEIKIFNENPDKLVKGELSFESDGLKIQSITNLNNTSGRRLKITGNGQRHTARFYKLSSRTPVVLWIELQLNEKPNSIGNLLESRLKVTLKSKTKKLETVDSTYIKWSVTNCAASYHTALLSLHKSHTDALKTALNNTRTSDKFSLGKWLFKPVASYELKPRKIRKCQKRKRYWNREKRRWSYRCLTFKTITKNIKSLTKESQKLDTLYKNISAIVYSRGRVPSFKKNTGDYWVTKKISEDLKRYMTQPPSPVMCTGAPQLTQYYSGKFNQVRTRAQNWKEHLIEAQKLAVLNIEIFINALSGSESVAFSEEKIQKISLILKQRKLTDKQLFTSEQLINNLAKRIKQKTLDTLLSESPDLYSKLKSFREYQKNLSEEKDVNQEILRKLKNTLFLIEAIYHLEQIRNKFDEVISVFDSKIEGIIGAHKKHCICAS